MTTRICGLACLIVTEPHAASKSSRSESSDDSVNDQTSATSVRRPVLPSDVSSLLSPQPAQIANLRPLDYLKLEFLDTPNEETKLRCLAEASRVESTVQSR